THYPPFLFTSEMSGCTFAVGGQHPATSPLVAHSNMVGDDRKIDQVAIGVDLDKVYRGEKYTTLEDAQYTGSKHFNVASKHVRATTFGVWDGKTWRFWSQAFEDCHKALDRRTELNNKFPKGKRGMEYSGKLDKTFIRYELLGVRPL